MKRPLGILLIGLLLGVLAGILVPLPNPPAHASYNFYQLQDTGPIPFTQAQILTLNTVPVQLIPAPASATQFILPVSEIFTTSFGTHAYIPANGIVFPALNIQYGCAAAANSNGRIFITDSGATKLLANTSSQMIVRANSVGSPFTLIGLLAGTLEAPSVALQQQMCLWASKSYNVGPISTFTIAAAGTGYAVGDTGTIDVGVTQNDSGDATYAIDTVSGGTVATMHITTPGASYTVTDGASLNGPYVTHTGGAQPGVGNNDLTLNVVTVSPVGDSTMTVDVQYGIVGQ